MKIKLLLIIFLFVFSEMTYAQIRRCAANEWTKEFEQSQEFPRLSMKLREVNSWKSVIRNRNISTVPDTIAVVVHVVWSDPSQNIPDSTIFRQIEVLNKDFPRLNDDTVNTPIPFAAIAGRANFVFQLARRNPFGAMTNGIVRRQTNHGPFSSIVDLIQTSTGGDDTWGGRYLNIYCVKIDPSTGAAGLAWLSSNLCMVDYNYFGIANPISAGRVCTHEVGHCFGLKHIWGSEPEAGPFDCADDDGIADTPTQYQPSSICATYPKLDSCTNTGDGIMYVDYMDYTWGTCQNMFSQGQVDAMNQTLTNTLTHLLNSSGLDPVQPNDAGIVSIIEPQGASCGVINPKIVIRNWGAQPLTSAKIYYSVDNNLMDSVSWTGNLNNFETDTIVFPTLGIVAGNHVMIAYTSLPNNSIDGEMQNDSSSSSFSSGSAIALPVTEGFENSFPPNGWALTSPDTAFGFQQNTSVSYSGNNSMMFYGRIGATYGGENIATIQTSFDNFISPYLSFKYAHTYADCCGDLDTLDVFVSNDCGQTYSKVSSQFGNTISTSPVVTVFSDLFVPTSSEWADKFIDLSSYAGSPDITIKFRLVNMWGLQFYMDDVNINGSIIGIDEVNSNKYSLYPNPSKGSFFIPGDGRKLNVEVLQSDGKMIFEKRNVNSMENIEMDAVPGIYFVRITDQKSAANYKLVIN